MVLAGADGDGKSIGAEEEGSDLVVDLGVCEKKGVRVGLEWGVVRGDWSEGDC